MVRLEILRPISPLFPSACLQSGTRYSGHQVRISWVIIVPHKTTATTTPAATPIPKCKRSASTDMPPDPNTGFPPWTGRQSLSIPPCPLCPPVHRDDPFPLALPLPVLVPDSLPPPLPVPLPLPPSSPTPAVVVVVEEDEEEEVELLPLIFPRLVPSPLGPPPIEDENEEELLPTTFPLLLPPPPPPPPALLPPLDDEEEGEGEVDPSPSVVPITLCPLPIQGCTSGSCTLPFTDVHERSVLSSDAQLGRFVSAEIEFDMSIGRSKMV